MDIEDKLEQLLIECQVNPEFSGQAVYELIYHFEHNNLNQYCLIIIKQVLAQKEYSGEKSEVIPFLLDFLAESDYLKSIAERDSDSAIQLAILLFKILYVLDLEEIKQIEL